MNGLLPNVTIKQEKITPPSSPKHELAMTDVSDDTLNLFRKIVNDEPIESKPLVKPIKSSNQILAELFQVFNAAPPEVDDVDSKDLPTHHKKSKKSKKKHKKEKKTERKSKKKHKKHKKSDKNEIKSEPLSDENDTTSSDSELEATVKAESKRIRIEPDERSGRTKRIKKEPKEEKHRSKEESTHSSRKCSHSKTHESSSDQLHSTGDKETMKNDSRLRSDGKATASTSGASTYKIVIKNLSNSALYKESVRQAEAKEKSKSRMEKCSSSTSRANDDNDSAFSISDEDEYLKDHEDFHCRRKSPGQREHDRFYGSESRRTSSERDRDRHHRSRSRHNEHDHRDRDIERRDERRFNRNQDRREDDNSRRRERRNCQSDSDKRSSSKSHRYGDDSDRIDKRRLLEIARKNAISMLSNGTLPGTQNLAVADKEKILTKMRYGGKSVDELTEFCKKLSKGESAGYLSHVSDDSDHDADGGEKAFHHPFVLKDRGPIIMNIKNATPIPPKTSEQAKAILMQFPVSSGQQHRQTETEWVPVEPKPVPPPKKEPLQSPKMTAVLPAIEAPSPPLPVPVPSPQTVQSVFPTVPVVQNLDVSTIITQRLNAMRKLQDNPLDSEAIKSMYNTQKDMSAWANSKFVPGQFTGSTGANILSAKELQSGFQAWAKRDQLIATTPVSGGMGMHLLQKMGWRPGEGLGKEKSGSLEPLLLEVKLDKKGLVATEETPQGRAAAAKQAKRANNIRAVKQNMESKHPVSLLGEICAKRKFGAPMYELVSEEGPFHSRQFLFKVIVNNMTYQPDTPSLNKKEAKAVVARHALYQMGLIQSAQPTSSTENISY